VNLNLALLLSPVSQRESEKVRAVSQTQIHFLQLIFIIIKLRKGYFPEVRRTRENNPFEI
jgi:hypothetical protein